MSPPYNNNDISTIEELDPEPPPRGSALHLREFVLGVLLLVGVLGWAGWQWWQQDRQQSNYRMGEQAAIQQHWDEAHDHFAAASGYRDADKRATEAAKSIAARNKHYDAATAAISDTQWLAAFSELQAVSTIQPDYKDSRTLYSQAESRVYGDALDGAIALRTGAGPPGLYYRKGDTWVWLQGSDIWSRVRNSGQVAAVVYDVPGEGWSPRPTPTPVPPNREPASGSPELKGRRLEVASLEGDQPTFNDLSFDPTNYSSYAATKKGVVAERFYGEGSPDLNPVRASSYGNIAIDYEVYGSPITTTVVRANDEQAVLDISAQNDLVLWARWSGISVRNSDIKLYMSRLDGTDVRVIYTHTGEMGGAQFSPDGRHILLTIITSDIQEPTETQTELLMDLTNPEQVHKLAVKPVSVETIGGYFRHLLALRGTFLRKGAFAGKILTANHDKDGIVFTMHDVANPDASVFVQRIDGPVTLGWLHESQEGAGLLINGFKNYGGFSNRPSANFLVWLVPGKPATVVTVADPSNENVLLPGALVMRDGYILYSGELANGTTLSLSYTLYSILKSSMGSDKIAPTQVYTTTELHNGAFVTGRSLQNTVWYMGPHLFAYTEGSSLHARTYDGSRDALLENGVTYLFDPLLPTNTLYLR